MPSPTNPILFQLGPFIVRWYGVLIMTGALLAAYIAGRQAKRYNENPDHVWDLLLWVLLLGFLGARLYHVFSTPAGGHTGFHYYFVENPFDTVRIFGLAFPFPTTLMIWRGGLGIFGGLVGGVLGLVLYARRHSLNVWRWLDILSPGMLLAQAIGRWGNYVNQELYGPPTNLPWGIKITLPQQRIPPYNNLTQYPLETTTFHPVFLYESLWNLAGFALLLWISRKYAPRLHPGDVASLYLVWYPVGRILVESLRPDAWTVGSIPTAQLVSAGLIAVGLGLMVYRRRWAGSQ